MNSISFSKIPFSLPLAVSFVGTVGSIALGVKKAHVIFGAAMTGFALLHAFQRRKALIRPVTQGIHQLADRFEVPHTGPDFFLRGVDVNFFMPGRIRLYCHTLQNDAVYKVWIQKYLKAFTDIGRVDMNHTTGSILITYDVDKIKDNVDLLRVESYMRDHALRRVI